MRRLSSKRLGTAGFTYVEVLVAVIIVSVAIGPTINAFLSGMAGARAHLTLTTQQSHVATRLEEVLAMPFDALNDEAVLVANSTVPTAFSDPLAAPERRLVYLARYDADNADLDGNRFTGGDDGLVWVRIEIEGTRVALETLTNG